MLEIGLNFAITSKLISKVDLTTMAEAAQIKRRIQVGNNRELSKMKPTTPMAETQSIHQLKKGDNIKIFPANKGNQY